MPSTALVDKIHAEIAIRCESRDCSAVFLASTLPSEPIEEWSVRAATEAERLGWFSNPDGTVKCLKCMQISRSSQTEMNLGPEWDEELLSRLRTVVARAGGSMAEVSYGVGGSQEVVSYKISLPRGQLEAVAETYAGLLLRGPASLVSEVADAVRDA